MKKILFLLLFSNFISFSQTNIKVGSIFKLKETNEYQSSTEASFSSPKSQLYQKDDLIEVVSIDCEDVIVKNLFTDSYTKMSKADLLYKGENQLRQYKGAEVGLYTIPFRLRGSGDNFDFEASLSLQTNIVFGFGKRDSTTSWIDLSAGLGISSINLDSTNSNVTEERTASALTTSFGAVIKPAENVNIGLFLGGDFLGKKDRDVDWEYNKNLWIGLGINISFNKIETTKERNVSEKIKTKNSRK